MKADIIADNNTHMDDRMDKVAVFSLKDAVKRSWDNIPYLWPLKGMVASSPLKGYEDLPFQEALRKAFATFYMDDLPDEMLDVNRITMKYCQGFFEKDQATLPMPGRHLGLYKAWSMLAPYDCELTDKLDIPTFIENLPDKKENLIQHCLDLLSIEEEAVEILFIILLASLPGWSAYVHRMVDFSDDTADADVLYDYLALRLSLLLIFYPHCKSWIESRKTQLPENDRVTKYYGQICGAETLYKDWLVRTLETAAKEYSHCSSRKQVQAMCCIDVRSEPFRRELESSGIVETFGFAGFFGLPIHVHDKTHNTSVASCPVLLKPEYKLSLSSKKPQRVAHFFKKLYQSMKYNILSPFALAEAIGIWAGLWIVIRNILPWMKPSHNEYVHLSESCLEKGISIKEQCTLALNILRGCSLTDHFSPVVMLIGHGSQTVNNAYASMLDCGACGGMHGDVNARVAAMILNHKEVRDFLRQHAINIPDETQFIGALHNTTTNQLDILSDQPLTKEQQEGIDSVQLHLSEISRGVIKDKLIKASNWAEVRPEWGLANNASFIIGPRDLTSSIDLQGRSFLHSYDWGKDTDHTILASIMSAPMVVAQWINAQYLFSSLDPVTFGAGSKVTKNITGKIGIMQGNGSDLMHGLPWQSVWKTDSTLYHHPVRLNVVIYASEEHVRAALSKASSIQYLIKNGWIHLYALSPAEKKLFDIQL